MEYVRSFAENINSRINFHRLKRLVGDAVSLMVSNEPFPSNDMLRTKYIIIKRPANDEWKPNYFSPVTGHIEEEDRKKLRSYPPPWNEERLKMIAGTRELRQEVKREPSLVNLRSIGKYHDIETDYDVHVLTGYAYGAGTTPKNIVTPRVEGTEESPEVHWMPLNRIEELIGECKFAGEKTVDMVVQDLQRFTVR